MKVKDLIKKLQQIEDQERDVIYITNDGEERSIEFVDVDEFFPDVEIGKWDDC